MIHPLTLDLHFPDSAWTRSDGRTTGTVLEYTVTVYVNGCAMHLSAHLIDRQTDERSSTLYFVDNDVDAGYDLLAPEDYPATITIGRREYAMIATPHGR